MNYRQYIFLLFVFAFCICFHTEAQVKIIPNKGQWTKNFLYKADVVSGAAFFEKKGIKYIFHDAAKMRRIHHGEPGDSVVKFHALYVDFEGAKTNSKQESFHPSDEFYNYYSGKDESRWVHGVHAYSSIKYQNIYEGINLKVDADDEALKFTWEVEPFISPDKIKMRISGADNIEITVEGELKITTSLNIVTEQKPQAWQYINGVKKDVSCSFYKEDNIIGFRFPQGYNKTEKIIIDPTVIFATFSGSKADNFGFTATYDSVGTGYSGGTVYNYPGDSSAFPVTAGAFQKKFGGGNVDNNAIGDYDRDCGILKYNPTGTKLLWATYLGGKGNEQPHSMVVDGKNNLVIFGTTTSRNFAVTKNAYDTSYNDSTDIFITKFSSDSCKLLASTYVGGSNTDGLNGSIPVNKTKNISPLSANYADIYRGEVISDSLSNIYVATSTASKNFPVSGATLQNAYGGGGNDACVFKMNADLSKLLWSTYIGGSKYDAAFSLQADSGGRLFICGGTQSPYFFSDNNTWQKTIANDSADAFLCSITPDGSKVLNATYLGTKYYDQSYFVQLDKKQNVYLYGQTGSPAFPVINAKYYIPKAGQFITKFNHELDTILFSSVFGSPRAQVDISPSAFLVDDCGKIYVSGWGGKVNPPAWGGRGGNTTKMPITSDAFQSNTDGSDFYIAVFARDMDTLLFASYFGGTKGSEEHVDGGTSRFDKRGVIYQSVCGGCGGFSDFPTTAGAWSRVNKGVRPDKKPEGCNNLLFKVNLDIPDLIARFTMPPHICATYDVAFENQSVRAKGYRWFFGDGDTSTQINPVHKYKNGGTYTVTLVVKNLLSCAVTDTFRKKILVYTKAQSQFSFKIDTCTHLATFNSSSALASNYSWNFGNGDTSSSANPKYKYKDSGNYIVTMIADPGTVCADTQKTLVVIKRDTYSFSIDTCNNTVKVTSLSVSDSDFMWLFDDSIQVFNEYPKHQFTKAGKHTIKLIPRWQTPCDTITKVIYITPRTKPVVLYDIDTCSGIVSVKKVIFKDTNYAWVTGKDTVKGKSFSKQFAPGKFKVILITYYHTGCDDTTSFSGNIPQHHLPDFSYTNDTCNRTYKFKGVYHVNTTYHWEFGDGKRDTGHTPKPHNYASDSFYDVKLTINKGKSCEESVTKKIKPPTPPKAGFKFYIDSCTALVQFINTSTRSIKSSYWDFGDGAIATNYSPTHQYAKEGNFNIKLTTSKGTGCEDSAKAVINISGLTDELIIPNVITPDGDTKNDFFRIYGIKEKCGDYTLEVYNRWGQRLYKNTGRNLEWHGKTNAGVDVPAGVYYWIVKGNAIKDLEGTITVIR